MARIALALHGGAGATRSRDYTREIAHMAGLVEAARDRLNQGASAIDVVTDTVSALEACGFYVAGRGASPNLAGEYELDASLMSGADLRAGAVATLQGFKSPIAVARAVMEQTPHVLIAGDGAARFAGAIGAERVDNPAGWFTRAGAGEGNALPGNGHPGGGHPGGAHTLAHGTVGCVALDADGRLAAATSTGGVFGKMPGRVGDAPLIGAGTWADGHAAIGATGQGEFFIRVAAASQVAFRVAGGEPLEQAAAAVLEQIRKLGGEGGLISVDRHGNVSAPFNSEGMKRAILTADGEISSAAF